MFLDDWLSFAAVVEEKSFTAAADRLGLSPSVISKRIKHLEAGLGARLLQRSTRSLILTEAGQKFYVHCRRIKDEIEHAKLVVTDSQHKPEGLLRVHAPMSFGHMHLTPAIGKFLQQYPDIQIDLVLGAGVPQFTDSHFDLAVVIKDLPDSTLVATPISVRHIGIYGSPAYFKKQGTPQTPEDLKAHNCLAYYHHQGRQTWQFLEGSHKKIAIEVHGNFRTNNSQALVKAAVAGLGIAKLSSFMVTEELRQQKLVSVLTEYCRQNINIYAVYPNKNYLTAKSKLFIAFLREYFAHSD